MDPNKAFRLLKKQPRPDPDGHLLNNAEYIEDWLIDGRCPSCGAIIENVPDPDAWEELVEERDCENGVVRCYQCEFGYCIACQSRT